jgi:MFS transporter, DHA1 family, tetracycline resistance protein
MVVFVDMIGFGLIMPLLPYYAESFNANPLVIGFLVASFAAASLIGAPIMGRLSDRYGRRPILLLSVAGTLIGYLFLGFAPPIGILLAKLFASHYINTFTIATLFFSRIIDGLTAGNITTAQAYISDVTDEKNRSRGFGLIGSAFGLGFILGPALGGVLSQWSIRDPAFASAILAFINMISILFFLPESLTDDRRAAIKQQQHPSVTYRALMSTLNLPRVKPLLLVRFIIMFAYTIFWSIFGLYAKLRLNLSMQTTGFVMAYIGFYSVLVQGVGIGWLTKHYKDNSIIITSLWLMFLGLIGWSVASNLPVLLLVILPLSGGGWTLNTILTSALTKAVNHDEIGGVLGISAATDSVARLFAPLLGGFMLGGSMTWIPGIVSAALLILVIAFAYRRIQHASEPIEPGLADAKPAESIPS